MASVTSKNNRMTLLNWFSHSFNDNGKQTGRTLSGTAYTLSYDYDGQLTEIQQGQTSTTFVYDALGRRYSRTAGGTTTVFLYGPGGIILEKQGNNYTAAYTYGNGLLRREGEYPLFDGHGSARAATNSGQTVTSTANYEAFGQTVGTTGSSASPHMYAGAWGYRNDGDAGLMHVGARYYDAQVGRFVTRDTDLGEHPYLYCEHDPVNAVDPTGEDGKPVGWERGVGPNGEQGWWKIGKDGSRVFEPDPPSRRPPGGHDRGRNVRPRGGEEHSRIPKGSHGPPAVHRAVEVGTGVLVGWALWEIGKWAVAAATAMPTGGGSLLVAGGLP